METSPVWRELVAIGQVARAQGRKGEVAVNPLTDFPHRFRKLTRVFTEMDDGRVVSLPLEWVREQGGRPVLKFQGISGIGEAERLSGRELRILEAELEPLPDRSYYHYRLGGCEVWDRRLGRLGVVQDVMRTGGADLLVVRDQSGAELLIPMCEEICRSVDVERSRIEVETPDGLVTINAR